MPDEKIVNIFKAQSPDWTQNVTIRLCTQLPDMPGKFYEKAHRDRFKKEAIMLADALCETLPGGTIDALLCEMLDRKRSLLVVRYKWKGRP